MERSEIQESARQRKETETAPPLSVSRRCLSSPHSAEPVLSKVEGLHLGYVADVS